MSVIGGVSEVRRKSTATAPLYLGGASLALWALAVHAANFLNMTWLGLASVLGWPYFLGLTLLVVALTTELMGARQRPHVYFVLIGLLVLYMFGTACAVEPTASLTDSYIHAGFIQYILQHGTVLNGYDARFSWPGGFSLGAMIVAFVGQANALGFLRWFPLVIELLYMAPLLVIAKFSGVNRRASWLAVALFYVTDWIYQDYFSPQALNYFFFLVVFAIVFACLGPQRHSRGTKPYDFFFRRVSVLRARLLPARASSYETTIVRSPAVTTWMISFVALLALASAMSHQLTPYAIILGLGACTLTRRLARPELVPLALLFAFGWLSLGASNYWIGHLSTIFGQVGQISSAIGSNVTDRLSGSAGHRFVVDARILITAGLYFLAGLGVLIRRPNTRTLEALTAAPFMLLAAQSYGGEGLLRVVLFGLPFTALLAASAVLPAPGVVKRRFIPQVQLGVLGRRVRTTLVAIIILGFATTTTVVRGGNDAYESFSKSEVQAVDYTYDHVLPGQTIGVLNSYLPFGQRDVGTVSIFYPLGGGTPNDEYGQKSFLKVKPEWVILSRAQEAYGEIVVGFRPGWESVVETYLLQHGYRVAFAAATATVLRKG